MKISSSLALLLTTAAMALANVARAADEPAPALTVSGAPAEVRTEGVPYFIERGERIDLALKRWSEKSGWSLQWLPQVSWECPVRAEFKGDIVSVVTQVVVALNQDGKRLRLRVYDGGQYMEVVSDVVN